MYEQPELGFSYDALEPHFDKETLEIHYTKHHAAYVKKFNAAEEGTDSDDKALFDFIKDIENDPEDIRTALSLREFEGLSYEEIANVLACPIGTVRSRIYRGRETIQEKINFLNEGKGNKHEITEIL